MTLQSFVAGSELLKPPVGRNLQNTELAARFGVKIRSAFISAV